MKTLYNKTIASNILLILLCSLASNIFAQVEDFAIKNQCLIQLKDKSALETILQNIPYAIAKETLSKNMNIFLIEKGKGNFSKDEIEYIAKQKNVIAAQYNHKVERRSLIPNDTYFSQQWNMLNTGQFNGKPGVDINAPKAWDLNASPLAKNGDTLVVAVFDDEYFDLQQEDINFFVNRNEIPDNGIDDDGNGFIDDYNGWNAYTNTGDVMGVGGSNHSTGIAGIIGAYGNNAKGVAGVVWGVKILPIGCSSTDESVVIKGYDYAIEMRRLWNQTNGVKGALVVAGNSSFGVDKGKPANFPIWCALYDTMGSLGILNAASTTNQGLDVDAVGDIPTTCPSKWLINVNGFSAADYRYGGYGLNNIDIAAPATSVISTVVNNNYSSQSGTSFACPHIAGAVAAMFAEACPNFINHYFSYPDSLSLYIKEWMLQSVSKSPAFNNKTTSDGRLNLYQAILSTHNYNCNNCNYAVSTQLSNVHCKGANDGSINIVVQNSTNYTVLWSDGDTASFRANLKPDIYEFTVTDNNACEQKGVVFIREPDSLIIESVGIVTPQNGSGNLVVNAIAGNDSLWYSLDSINWQLNNIFSISQIGNYVVYVKNESGCIVSQTVVVSSINDIEVFNQIYLQPNPVKDILMLHCFAVKAKTIPIQIFDISGRLLLNFNNEFLTGKNELNIDVQNFANGIYFLKLNTLGIAKKFVVSK